MTPARIALGTLATLGLITLDHFTVAAAFLSAPERGGWLLAAAVAVAVLAVVTRRGLFLFLAQNGLIAGAIMHVFRDGPAPNIADFAYFTVLILLGNLLTLPIARMLTPARQAP